MTVQLVDAQISIGNVAVTRQGLKTIMFAARHNYFAERSRQNAKFLLVFCLKSLGIDCSSLFSNVVLCNR